MRIIKDNWPYRQAPRFYSRRGSGKILETSIHMATYEPYTITSPTIKSTYTLSEAVEYMKMRDRFPTINPPLRWVSVTTGKPVSIGYA